MGDFDLRMPEMHIPEPESPLHMPPLQVAHPGALPLDVMERASPIYPYIDPAATQRAFDRLPPQAPARPTTPHPREPAPPATRSGLMWQIGLTDDPGATVQASRRAGRSDWTGSVQVGASTQSDNPNSTDRINRVQEHSPLGTPDVTPGASQIPTQGQTPDNPPQSLGQLVQGVTGQPPPTPEALPTLPLPPVPRETMCREPARARPRPAPRR